MESFHVLNRHLLALQQCSFGIVLSPGVLSPGDLTEAGFTEIKRFCENARALGVDMMEYALSCISTSDMKLYCQIPFDASSDSSVVIDQRSEREIIHQMRDFIVSGEADDSWISP